VVYVALSFLLDPRGTMGADEGAKVATLKVMAENGTFRPDVGYWASQWDPEGVYHGLTYTTRFGEMYVNVSTLPMILVGKPLWDFGGYRGALLLPMLGGVLTALAARSLAMRLVDHREREAAGLYAFWLVGLASPATVYALDLWEHTLGLAAMAWAVVHLVDASAIRCSPGAERPGAERPGTERTGTDRPLSRSTLAPALAAGALFGAAVSMRTEALVYLVVTVGLAAFTVVLRREVVRAVALGMAALVGFGVLVGANTLLELAVLGSASRAGRATVAVSAGGQDVSFRVKEGLTTLLSPMPSLDPTYVAYGVLFALGVGLWAMAAAGRAPKPCAALGGIVVVVVVLLRVQSGLGFWPGMVATTPMVAVGLALGWTSPAKRLVTAMGLAALPLVVAFQFPGGAIPQWGGRYMLLSGFLVGVVGIASLTPLPRESRLGLMGLSLLVTALGFGWLVVRTHGVGEAGEVLAARPEAVLISPEGFPPREFGATWGSKRWLSTLGRDDLPGAVSNGRNDLRAAVDIVRQSGAPTFAIVTGSVDHPFPDFPGFREVSRSSVPFVPGAEFVVVSYARA